MRQSAPTFQQELSIKNRMFRVRRTREDLLPLLSELQRQFQEKFHREMTPEEIRLYTLTKDMIEKPGFVERRVFNIAVEKERRQAATEKAS